MTTCNSGRMMITCCKFKPNFIEAFRTRKTPMLRTRKLAGPFLKRDRLVNSGLDQAQAEAILELLEEVENEQESITAPELKHAVNRISSKLNIWLVILIAFDIVAAAPHASPESMLGKILSPLISILY